MGTRKVLYDQDGNVARRPVSYAYGGAHSNASQARCAELLEDREHFTDAEARVVMWFLMRSPGHGEPIRMSLQQIADRLHLQRPALSNIVKRLKERRVLIPRDKAGRTQFYALNPYLGGLGSAEDQREAIRGCNPPELPTMEIAPADVTAGPRPSTWKRSA
ncbi:MarR family transcriptional regulator [Streptomyces sp. SR27]|uniref:MarR family transcriptional regulator n=1 Tax=Streptomyces sp. SR27 TaxID=3076630 RepID=UPI000B029925|nr:MarR family transcriptional regulator [Streptomyces sp. SR27]MDV9190949.1 MarR family transcriptional regulator [Streptomyces sp. SR27]